MEYFIVFIGACIVYIVTVYTIAKELDSVREELSVTKTALMEQEKINKQIFYNIDGQSRLNDKQKEFNDMVVMGFTKDKNQ